MGSKGPMGSRVPNGPRVHYCPTYPRALLVVLEALVAQVILVALDHSVLLVVGGWVGARWALRKP